ncbi:MAG: hypothetical protein IJS39_16670 [Synergistaceae bacterium]|nr:hypothetical protein [Synergistaceae bacterium]
MKRTLTITIKTILFTAGFISALWFFLPWREAGKAVMSVAYSRLSASGMRMNYSDISGESDGFTVHNLALNGMANLRFSSVTLRPRMLASVLSLAPVCDVSFRGGSVQLGMSINFGDGGVLVTAGRSEVMLENLRTNGDFAMNGWLAVNPQAMRITRADARLNVPESFSQNMAMLQNFLPLVQQGDRWYLRRN